MGSESTPTSIPTDAAPGQPPLATLVARAPDLVRRMLAAATPEAATETDPRLPARRCTAIIATYCEHLAAMEMTVYAVARRRLPDGEQAVAVVEALAHDAELVMREMEERIGGDRFAAARPFAALQDRFEVAFAAHVEAERALVSRLQGRLAPAEQDALGTRLDSALRHAPTRPHPYGPHTSRLTPLAFRLRALADHTLDVMDNRRGAGGGSGGPTCSAWRRPRRPRDRRRSGPWRVAGRRHDGRHHLA